MRLSAYILFLFLFLNVFESWGFCEDSKVLLLEPQIKRVLDLGRQIRCPVCHGQPVSESNAPLARTILCFIAQGVFKNQKDEDILKDLENRFGESINLDPALKPETYFLWFVPIFLFLGCGFGCIFFLKTKRRRTS